jgi:ubiquinone/menaquinone biosynthesis C-methylase UbiE
MLLSQEGFEVTATDISKTGISMTKKSLKEEKLSAQFKECSCYEKFPFKDNSFDAIISTQVIHHNYHDKVLFCISEIERVVKPRGIIFITVSANKYKSRTVSYKITAPRTYVPLDGEEKGLPHYIYTQAIMRKDFKNFKILDLFKDKTSHLCLIGQLKE